MNNNLDTRIDNEKEAYSNVNIWVNREKYIHTNFQHVFESINTKNGESLYYQKITDNALNKHVLDFGCFNGDLTPFLVSANSLTITGIDISSEGISQAIKLHGKNANFVCGDAHRTPFENASFDLIVGKGILHHLEYKLAIIEINRILKPGGTAIFFEPLMGGWISKLLRLMLPNTRTLDEKPLSKYDIEFANNIFKYNDHHFINFVTVPIGMLSTFLSKNSNNLALTISHKIDSYLSKTFMKYYMRAIIIHWVK